MTSYEPPYQEEFVRKDSYKTAIIFMYNWPYQKKFLCFQKFLEYFEYINTAFSVPRHTLKMRQK